MATKKDRLGETRMMNCGMEATIIRYGRCDDIDVRFEDGAVAEHKGYHDFKKSKIANPDIKTSAKNCLGETRMMNCGMKATIIRYGKYADIDVRFEDGAVAKNKAYGEFKKGGIANPNIKTFTEVRLGETRLMNCGMEATIIRYGGATDIDVRFEDGTIAKCKGYKEFKKGGIANPNFNPRLGETRGMNCGMEATIIRYENSRDIDVRFEDGAIAKHKLYGEFKKGGIANPNIKTSAENCLGETKMMNCGMKATIIRYGGYNDIDVRFEDGAIAKCRGYKEFKKGSIANPNIKASRLGETRMMSCGMKATIIRYENSRDIDVRFEDGAIAKHKLYGEFKKGGIAHPSTTAKARLGEARVMKCSMEAIIIRYGSATDIDVRFKDGTVVKSRRYSAFQKGEIANPNIKTSAENCLGETRMMNCGMEATIIRYGGCNDIDVRFEDGKVVVHKAYDKFKKGSIAHPNTKVSAKDRLGETRMMNCGMKATIIRYGKCMDIDVRFEDGKVVEHRRYGIFKKGEIAHQSISQGRGSKDFHGFICKRGFIDEDRTLYECICKHCGLEDVLTPQEMMEHEKLEHGEDK